MDDKKSVKGVSLNINVEKTPVLYTDNIFMSTNEDGVVLDVGQKLANTNQVQIVTRVGMSRNHAKKFLKELARLVAMTEGKSQTGEKKN
jgi:hypothetical protein